MEEAKLIKTVNFLLGFASFLIFAAVTHLPPEKEEPQNIIIPQETIEIRDTEVKQERESKANFQNSALTGEMELRNSWQSLEISYITIEYDYLCRGYITAYCAAETGSYETASGITCHWSEDPYEPSTVAIDRRYYRFGQIFSIDGKLYIAEDTGSAVLGNHWDVYMPDWDSMASFGSHYTDVYTVEYVTHTLERKVSFNAYFNSYLLSSSVRNRSLFGPYR